MHFVCSLLVSSSGDSASYSGVRDLVCGLAMGPPASCRLALVRDLGNAWLISSISCENTILPDSDFDARRTDFGSSPANIR